MRGGLEGLWVVARDGRSHLGWSAGYGHARSGRWPRRFGRVRIVGVLVG